MKQVHWFEKILKEKYNNIWPVCACGCGEKVKWKAGIRDFSRYKQYHSGRIVGKQHSIVMKQKIKDGTWSPWSKGLTKETDERVRLMGKKQSETLRKNKRIMSEEGKQSRRIGMVNHLKKYKWRIIGKKEIELLNEQEVKDNCKILKQFDTGIGYITDGYCPETNTVYEIYEKRHLNSIEKDEIRKQRIIDHLKCNFKTIWV
jgi:hypothetical protein